ncbi:hypothetical protein BC827DRAFT_744324 [Russula dissimulans]|nr:hypothetical protein BC827DRAFT_744324 [Russula dissimulans]
MESVLPQPSPAASSGARPIVNAEDPGFVPMYRLPPPERARSRAQMDRILDILEEEERVVEERNQVRDWEQHREELERRKANAKAEFERIKAAKEIQKKMGKALLKNMADAREKEEEERARQEREDMELEEARRSRKPRKSVSWAELPKQERPPARSDADDGRTPLQIMRPNVVERFPIRPGAASPPPLAPVSDSDDESNPEQSLTDDSQDEGETVDGDGSDIDSIQHQREIALAYFEKRNAIGADAARAMSTHSPDLGGENDWDQEDRDVLPDTTLSGHRPKPTQSRFRSESERLAQVYGTRQPPVTAPASLGSSALPHSTDALRGAVRMGRLEADQLVGDDDGDGEHDAARTREFMDALNRGDVTNAGAAENSNALIAALESAYGAPPGQRPPPPAASPATGTAPVPAPTALAQKNSRFKLARAAPPSTLAPNDKGPREGGASPSRPPPTSNTVVERKAVRPHATASSPPAPPGALGSRQPATAPQIPSMIVDSPSFAPPGGDAPAAVIDSPSFRPPLPSARLTRPSAVVASTVREPSGTTQQQKQKQQQPQPVLVPEPGKPVSRFKAQRAES